MREPRPAVASRDHWLPETVIVANPGPGTHAHKTLLPLPGATSKGSDVQAGHCHALLKPRHGLAQSSRCVYMGVLPRNIPPLYICITASSFRVHRHPVSRELSFLTTRTSLCQERKQSSEKYSNVPKATQQPSKLRIRTHFFFGHNYTTHRRFIKSQGTLWSSPLCPGRGKECRSYCWPTGSQSLSEDPSPFQNAVGVFRIYIRLYPCCVTLKKCLPLSEPKYSHL